MNIVQKSLNRVESLMRMRLPVDSVMKAGDLWYQRVRTAGRPTDWVLEDWVNQVEKAKKIAIGDIITRPDGTKWKKTSTFGYSKVVDGGGTPDATSGTPDTTKKPSVPAGVTVRSQDEIDEIFNKYGEKGVWQLNKHEFLQWLKDKGISDADKLGHKEKLARIGDLLKDMKEKSRIVQYKPFSNDGVKIKFNNGETHDFDSHFVPELMKYATPIVGGHWGSAKSSNTYAKMVAFSSAPQYRPIDKITDGKMQKHNYTLSESELKQACGLRKHAQEKVAQISRKDHPVIYRGMSLDANQVKEILSKKTDTIELTGATAFTFYEAIANRYSSSSWTQSVGGSGRISAKIILERDDAVDTSLGMWHHAHSDRNQNEPAFETLSGLESLKIDRVEANLPKNPVQKLAKMQNSKMDQSYLKACADAKSVLGDEKLFNRFGHRLRHDADSLLGTLSPTHYDEEIKWLSNKTNKDKWNKAHDIMTTLPKKKYDGVYEVIQKEKEFESIKNEAVKYQKLDELHNFMEECKIKTPEARIAFFRTFTNIDNTIKSGKFDKKAITDNFAGMDGVTIDMMKAIHQNYDKIPDKIGSLDAHDYKNDYEHYQKPSKILLHCRAGRGVKSLNDSNDQDLGDDSKTT